jgi:hypothetical protein
MQLKNARNRHSSTGRTMEVENAINTFLVEVTNSKNNLNVDEAKSLVSALSMSLELEISRTQLQNFVNSLDQERQGVKRGLESSNSNVPNKRNKVKESDGQDLRQTESIINPEDINITNKGGSNLGLGNNNSGSINPTKAQQDSAIRDARKSFEFQFQGQKYKCVNLDSNTKFNIQIFNNKNDDTTSSLVNIDKSLKQNLKKALQNHNELTITQTTFHGEGNRLGEPLETPSVQREVQPTNFPRWNIEEEIRLAMEKLDNGMAQQNRSTSNSSGAPSRSPRRAVAVSPRALQKYQDQGAEESKGGR